MNTEDITRRYPYKTLLLNHLDEVFASWSIFLGVVIGFYASMEVGWLSDFVYHEAFIQGLDGMITSTVSSFNIVFSNNLFVGFLTFILCFVSFSALVFVLVWNASLVSYYLNGLDLSFLVGLLLLPHGLLEVAGYVFSGVAGSILAYRVDNWSSLSHGERKEVWKDVGLLLVGATLFIFVGAVIETL